MNTKGRYVLVPAILVLCILAVIATPLFLKARKTDQRNACLNNLRMLARPMACCVPLSKGLKDGDEMDPSDVCMYIRGNRMPVCPAGGDYIVSLIVGGPTPQCSFHGDLILDVDHFNNLKEIKETHAKARIAQPTSAGDVATRAVPEK